MALGTLIIRFIFPPLLLLLGLMYFLLTDKYIIIKHKKHLFSVLVLITTMIASDVMDFCLTYVMDPDPTLRLINSSYQYICFPLLIVLVYYFVDSKNNYLPEWCFVGVNAAVYLINLFTPIAFSINENNDFVRRPLGFCSHFISVLLLLHLLFLTIRRYGRRPKYIVVPISCAVLLITAMLLDVLLPQSDRMAVSFMMITIVICCVFFFIWVHLHIIREYGEKLLEQQRIQIMVSQIQPHFLYNTIATIKALCKSDPDKAAQVAEDFGLYLRQNLDSLNNTELIPVEKELEHTQVYAEIEMVRFENVRVVYDIQDIDFSLPALSIQPMVENAIRHGVRIREEGIVRVSTLLSEGCHEIVISDNGIGFDTSDMDSNDKNHIGIANVRERIEKMCGGAMTIKSEIDKGTTVNIRIPETEKKS